MLQLRRFSDAQQFYDRAAPFLLEREAKNNVILGICTQLIIDPEYYVEPPYLALVENGDAIEMVAVRTPPHRLLISETESQDSLRLVAQDIQVEYETIPSVLGLLDTVHAFAAEWKKLTGEGYEVAVHERLFQLDQVIPVKGVSGHLRDIEEADRDLVTEWFEAFAWEALNEQADTRGIHRRIDAALTKKSRRLAVWVDKGRVVSMVGCGATTPNGARIGPVYTPPELRGRGYASACVAEFSQRLLDEGRRYCFLYTDLANPTSNRIYQNIGYYPVCDVDVLDFSSG